MFYDNELRIMQKVLNKFHVQTLIMDPTAPMSADTSQGLSALFGASGPLKAFYDYVSDVRPATVYRMSDMFMCRYIFFELPLYEKPMLFMAGPYLNTELTHQQVLEQAERMGFPARMNREVETMYAALPVIREEGHLFAVVNTFAEYAFSGEENYDTADIFFDQKALSPLSADHRSNIDTEEMDIRAMEQRYQYENDLMEAVSCGNTHKAELMMSAFSGLVFENRANDRLRNVKNYCIIMNTLMRKAAEKGRVHPVHLDRISSDFARRIERLQTVPASRELMLEILRSYCRLVKRHSMKDYSPLVQKAMILIENDLTGDLSLNAVAKKNNVSAGYLSSLFKKETGQTFTAYVNGRRVALAKHLLRTSNLQIQTIAQHCGILDFHYFCRLFKNVTGKTPSEYRSGHMVN